MKRAVIYALSSLGIFAFTSPALAADDLDWRSENWAGIRLPREYWPKEFLPTKEWRPEYPYSSGNIRWPDRDRIMWSGGVNAMLYPSVEYAKNIQSHLLSFDEHSPYRVEMGDEAYASPGPNDRTTSTFRRFYVRVGRLYMGSDVSHDAMLKASSEAEIHEMARKWIDGVIRWANDRGLDLYHPENGISQSRPNQGDKPIQPITVETPPPPTALPQNQNNIEPPMVGQDLSSVAVGASGPPFGVSEGGSPFSPLALTGFASIATAGITALGAGLMMFGMGVKPNEVIDGVRELFSGTPPEPPAYVEPSPPPPPIHRDGDVNESGEVWSDEDRGWVGRNLYDQEKTRRRDITDQLERERHSGQSEDVKKAYDDWQQSKEKLEAVREEGRMLVKKENLRQWVEDRERDLQEQSYWSDVKNNFLLNVDGELTALPHETFEICRETAKAVKSGVDAVSDVVKDATNWEILRATGAQTSRDILGSPLQSAGKVGKFYHDVTAGAGKVAVHIVANPLEIAKVVTGYENWSQALDYHVPLSKRIGHALMGTVDTVTMFGGAVAKEGGAALAKGIEAVDTVAEAAKAEKLAMEAGAIARKLTPEDLARHQAWELGEQQARQKVATLHASKNPGELRAAVLEIQGDKRGLQMLNGEASEVKATFNREIRGIYKETDAAVETRLRESLGQKGVDLDRYDLKPTHATNPSADPFKIGADRDITYSLYDKQSGQWVRDVPADQVQGVYNEEFFKAAHGRPPTGADDVAGFANKMDQQCVDSVHPEAYGRGPADLETALHQPGRAFQDPTAVGKSVSYKSHEWYGKSSDAMKAGDSVLAEQHLSEGFRQTTKQFDNLLVARHDALREAGTRGLKEIPERMQEAIDVLKTTHSGVSPVVVERQLAELGYHSPGELATHLGEYVEAMDKLRPGSAATINWRAAYTGARTVMAGYQQ
jgi:hypothetical protein